MLAEFRLRVPECTSTVVSDTILLRWLNEAQNVICRRTGCLKTYSETSTVANQSEYDIPNDLAMIDPEGGVVYYDASADTYYKLRHLTMGRLDQQVGDWRNAKATNTPEAYYRRGGVVGIYPKPDNASDTLRIYYWEFADAMTNDGDEPFNADTRLESYHDLLLLYAIQKAKETMAEFEQATYYKNLFEAEMNKMLSETETDYDDNEVIYPYYK